MSIRSFLPHLSSNRLDMRGLPARRDNPIKDRSSLLAVPGAVDVAAIRSSTTFALLSLDLGVDLVLLEAKESMVRWEKRAGRRRPRKWARVSC